MSVCSPRFCLNPLIPWGDYAGANIPPSRREHSLSEGELFEDSQLLIWKYGFGGPGTENIMCRQNLDLSL